MPRVDEIRLEILLSADSVEPLVEGAFAPLSLSTLTRITSNDELFALCPKERLATVTLRHKLILVCPLFSARQGAFDDSIYRALEGPHNPGNIVFFEASMSDGPYAWCGLDLKVCEWCAGSLEKALVRARDAESDATIP